MTGEQMAKMAGCLIKNGSDPNGTVQAVQCFNPQELGMTALHLLCLQRNEKLVMPMFRALISLGASPWMRDAKGRTVADLVIENQCYEIISYMVRSADRGLRTQPTH
jgi:ankyrin repeat protein